ncbi:hypothetical protein NA56DRAFT_682846 [Hyaloscypha hepaticicola]|uniref:Aminoglycoside phosphotransferase domain-containing protein n=1 Tax=Hyaloscypha hepaticicola TaxID=2082293 RepID=A0A2J6PID2_9HELO|nr:hypothetical protein NA56DRAFT_682846 [Hyaloscypha hepaticicola]
MDSLPSLSFFAAPDLLPAPLPTIEAIEASQDLLKEHDGRRVVRVGTHFVVKYGADVALTEGENMLFLKQLSTIKIPDVYAIYSRINVKIKLPTNYIVMENIDGECLDSCWASLDTQAKTAIVDQLRACFTQLRQLPSPGYYGLVGRRPYDNHIFWAKNDEERRMISGPFDSEEQMLEALMQKYVYNLPKYRKHECYSRILPLVLQNHAPVFTHGDLQRKSVIVKKDGTVVMIDWESAG